MKLFIAAIQGHTRSAKNKGIITGTQGCDNKETLITWAFNKQEAMEKFEKAYQPHDSRPLSGKSYLVEAKLDVWVYIPRGYKTGYDPKNGVPITRYNGKISEFVSEDTISVRFPGYYTEFVDFNLSEIGTVI